MKPGERCVREDVDRRPTCLNKWREPAVEQINQSTMKRWLFFQIILLHHPAVLLLLLPFSIKACIVREKQRHRHTKPSLRHSNNNAIQLRTCFTNKWCHTPYREQTPTTVNHLTCAVNSNLPGTDLSPNIYQVYSSRLEPLVNRLRCPCDPPQIPWDDAKHPQPSAGTGRPFPLFHTRTSKCTSTFDA